MKPPPVRPRRRRLLIVAGVLFSVVVALYLTAGLVLRSRLRAVVRKQLGGELRCGLVWYRPGLRFTVRGVSISMPLADGQTSEILQLDSISASFASLPRANHPVVIDQLVLRCPTLTLPGTVAKKRDGPIAKSTGTSRTAQVKRKASELLQVKDLRIEQCAATGGGAPNSVARGIQLFFKLQDGSSSTYDYGLSSTDADNRISSKGSFDVDAGIWKVDDLQVAFDASLLATLNPRYAEALRDSRLKGELKIGGKGQITLRTPSTSTFAGRLDWSDGQAHLTRWESDIHQIAVGIDVSTLDSAANPRSQASAQLPPVRVVVRQCRAVSGVAQFRMDSAIFETQPEAHAWKLANLLATLEGHATSSGAISTTTATGPSRLDSLFDRLRCGGKIRFTAAGTGPLQVARGVSPFEVMHLKAIAYPEDVSFQPAKFATPFTHVGGGTIELVGGSVVFKNLSAVCGHDLFLLDEANLTLEDLRRQIPLANLARQVQINRIAGAVEFHSPATAYPGSLGATLRALRPGGAFLVGGGSWMTVNTRRRPGDVKLPPDYLFHVWTDGGALALTDHAIPVTELHGKADVFPTGVDVTAFAGKTLGGTIDARLNVRMPRPVRYEGRMSLNEIAMAELAKRLELSPPKHGNYAGFGSGHVDFSGTVPVNGLASASKPAFTAKATASSAPASRPAIADDPLYRALVASGEFEVVDGDFYSAPVFAELFEQSRHSPEFTFGEAAGVFKIADGSITLSNGALSAPAFGLTGSGTIGFDKTLDLRAVAAPLGDWRERIKRGNIPLVSDVAAEIVGALQQVINVAQQTLLYDVRITGTIDQPVIKQVPTPILSDGSALLFGRMIKGSQPHQLIDGLREPSTQPQARKGTR